MGVDEINTEPKIYLHFFSGIIFNSFLLDPFFIMSQNILNYIQNVDDYIAFKNT